LRFVTPTLKHFIFPALSRSGYLRSSAGDGPAIVTYHGVFPAGYTIRNRALDGNLLSADMLRKQLRLLKSRYHVIAPSEFLAWLERQTPLPRRSILLTCDDALRNTLTDMLPVLREFELQCLFFATAASAEQTPSMLWYEEMYLMLLQARDPIVLEIPELGISINRIAPNEKHSRWWTLVQELSQFDMPSRRRFLDQIQNLLRLPGNWSEPFFSDTTLSSRFLMLDLNGLRQLTASGMTIGAHSCSHPILANMHDELANQEILESRVVLERALGTDIWAFGYPFGNAATVTQRDIRLAKQAGFRCAFMNTGGGFGAKINRFALPRVHVTADMSLAEFEAHVSGFYRNLRRRLFREEELDLVAS